jgi:hypothetical protein
MLRLLEFLWHGCWHNWEAKESGTISVQGVVTGHYFTYQCSKCFHIKRHRV